MELFKLLGTVALDGVADVKRDLDSTNDEAKKTAENFEKFATKVGEWSLKIAAATSAAATAIGSVALGSATNLEKAFNDFSSATGVAKDELGAYKDVLQEIYNDNYGESFEDIAASMSQIKQQMGDIDSGTLKDMTEDALLLRDTFDYDVGETTRAAKMLMDQFGISSKEAFNMIAQGTQKGLNKNGDLLDSINEYAVHYKQMGYDAKGFFNSLSNGTKAGTFSVDKLGDAMKEFGIRVKDTSTTTSDAFFALGYGSKKSTVDTAKLTKEISKLEKNIKYAKMEQEGFNEKTSELTKMKNADNIAEWSKELEIARQTLEAANKESESGGKNLEELQAKFAQGGDAAQEATQEVLEALFAMDDKVAQNAAGVGLFGTMWEDLGIEGIKALTEVEGSIDSATDALTDMSKVKYNDLRTQFESTKRKIETALIQPLGKKLEPMASKLLKTVEKKMPQIQKLTEKLGDVAVKMMDKLEPALEWLLDDALPVLVDLLGFALDNFTGLAGAVALFYGAVKTLSIINTLTTAIKGASGAMGVFNVVMSANPIGAVVAGVSTLVGGIALLCTSFETQEEKEAKARREMEEYRKQTEEARLAAEARREEIFNTAEAELGQTERTQKLWEELQTLCDETGNVKDADVDRAKFITGQLNDALGVEFEWTGKQITNYQDLQSEIENTLKLKKAEIALNAFDQNYQEAMDAMVETKKKLLGYEEEMIQAEKELQKVQAEFNDREKYVNSISNVHEKAYAQAEFDTWIAETYQGIANTHEIAVLNFNNTNKELEGYYRSIAQYENAFTMFEKGEYDKVEEYLEEVSTARINAADIAKQCTQEQLDQIKKQMQDSEVLMESAKKMMDGAVESEKEFFKKQYDEAKAQFEKDKALYESAAKTNATAYVEGVTKTFSSHEEKLKNIGLRISQGIAKGMQSGQKTLSNTARTLASNLIDQTQDVLLIKSPSRLFAKEVGAYIPSGIAMGIEDNEKDAIGPMRDMVGRMSAIASKDVVNNYSNTTTNNYGSGAVSNDVMLQLIDAIKNLKVYLNDDTLVGKIAPAMDMALGELATASERGQ